jgi:hypothetical protein
MVTNVFRWEVKPTIPGQWHTTERHLEFKILISGDWVEAHAEDNGKQESQRRKAEEIVISLVRYISLRERQRFATVLRSVTRFDSGANRSDVIVLPSGVQCIASSGLLDAVVASSEGTVLVDSRKERMLEMRRFVATKEDENVKRMSDYLLDYYVDPEKKLAPLFDIFELAVKVFRNEDELSKSLQIEPDEIRAVKKTTNERRIRTSRHRGQYLGQQRDVTSHERRRCEVAAERIVAECVRLAQEGKLPHGKR